MAEKFFTYKEVSVCGSHSKEWETAFKKAYDCCVNEIPSDYPHFDYGACAEYAKSKADEEILEVSA